MTASTALDRGMTAMLESWRERLAAGEKRIGWKIGLNLPAVQEALGLSHPVVGYLTSSGLLDSGASFSIGDSTRLSAEPEIAVRVGVDVPGDAGQAAARAAIESVAPAIEVVDIDRPLDDLSAILAGNVFHRAVVLGPTSPPAWETLTTVEVRLDRDGDKEAATNPQAGDEVVEMVTVVADLLARFGERLQAGDTIITGALTRAIRVEAGDHVTATIDPLGSVALRFEP